MQNGIAFRVLRRAATFAGLERHLNSDDAIAGREVTIFEANLDDAIEGEPCASRHRDRLRRSVEMMERPLDCVRCGRPVSEAWSEIVEAGTLDRPSLGLVHSTCLGPIDRIVGRAHSPFFERFPNLINFDVNGWVRAAHNGQRGFAGARSVKAGGAAVQMLWGGPEYRGPPKPFVVEVSLKNGRHEIVTHRNAVHRFTKVEAEAFAADLNASFEREAKAGNPLCYTDQSKGYGPRSILISQFGASEAIDEVSEATVKRFETRMEKDCSQPGSWYAPVVAMRSVETGELLNLAGGVPLLTDPLSVTRHLDNWRLAGYVIPIVETTAIISDTEFDDLMNVIDREFECALVDPMLDPGTHELLSGFVLASLRTFAAQMTADPNG